MSKKKKLRARVSSNVCNEREYWQGRRTENCKKERTYAAVAAAGSVILLLFLRGVKKQQNGIKTLDDNCAIAK